MLEQQQLMKRQHTVQQQIIVPHHEESLKHTPHKRSHADLENSSTQLGTKLFFLQSCSPTII